MLRYSVLVRREASATAVFVTVPTLPGCFTQGATVEQALEAILPHVEGFLERGERVPVEVVPPLLTVVEVGDETPLGS